MNPLHLRVFKHRGGFLLRNLADAGDMFMGEMVAELKPLFSHTQQQRIEALETRKEQLKLMVGMLPSCGEEAYPSLLRALKGEHDFIAEELERCETKLRDGAKPLGPTQKSGEKAKKGKKRTSGEQNDEEGKPMRKIPKKDVKRSRATHIKNIDNRDDNNKFVTVTGTIVEVKPGDPISKRPFELCLEQEGCRVRMVSWELTKELEGMQLKRGEEVTVQDATLCKIQEREYQRSGCAKRELKLTQQSEVIRPSDNKAGPSSAYTDFVKANAPLLHEEAEKATDAFVEAGKLWQCLTKAEQDCWKSTAA